MCVFVCLLQLLKAFKNTSSMHGTTHTEGPRVVFDKNGNPDIGYNLVEWVWKNGTLDYIDVGIFHHNLIVNHSLFIWHTPNSQVKYALYSKQLNLQRDLSSIPEKCA